MHMSPLTGLSSSSASSPPGSLLPLAGLALLLLGAIALSVGGDGQAGFLAAQSLAGRLPPWLWESLTTLGDERMLLALMLPFCLRYPAAFWSVCLASLLAVLAVRGLKTAVPMPRPADVLDAARITVIGARRAGHSFPSNHAASVFAFAAVWGVLRGWRLGAPLLAVAALVGFSRIAVGAHWPIDVLAGALIGTLAAAAGLVLAPRLRWGLRPGFHWTLVGAAAIAVATLPVDSQGYPGSLLVRCVLCAWGLAGFWRHYLGPLHRDGWAVASRRTDPTQLEKS